MYTGEKIAETLADERCGLYFLVGLDQARGSYVLTVHAAEGALSVEHETFIKTELVRRFPELRIHIRRHSSRDLYTPESLERFSQLFPHDSIVADPTGAFARVSKLLTTARLMRDEFGRDIGRVLWQADTAALVVVVSPRRTVLSAGSEATDLPALASRVRALFEARASADLKRVVRSISVSDRAPSGKHTPVDVRSHAVRSRKRRLVALVAKISSIAALIGLGTVSVANARMTAMVEEGPILMPGITGLVGLTTLGENSFGVRNRFQAVGGLRLYFGETGILMAAAVKPDTLMRDNPRLNTDSQPRVPAPTRVSYGS